MHQGGADIAMLNWESESNPASISSVAKDAHPKAMLDRRAQRIKQLLSCEEHTQGVCMDVVLGTAISCATTPFKCLSIFFIY